MAPCGSNVKDFPDDWARDLTDSWIMDTEQGFGTCCFRR